MRDLIYAVLRLSTRGVIAGDADKYTYLYMCLHSGHTFTQPRAPPKPISLMSESG